MANMACGMVTVQGHKGDILEFTERFISSDEIDNKTTEFGLYFNRSFVYARRREIFNEVNGLCSEGISTFELFVFFAWSAESCIINVKNNDEHISLSDACKLDGVSVTIHTEECDIEEYITCDSDGNLNYECERIPEYECPHCGSVMAIPSYIRIEENECCECGKLGLVLLPNDDDESEAA